MSERTKMPDLIDSDGDRWVWDSALQGYTCGDMSGWSREHIAVSYGPVRETPEICALLADVLEDVARKLREGG